MKYAAYSYDGKSNPEVVVSFSDEDMEKQLPGTWFHPTTGNLIDEICIEAIGKTIKLFPKSIVSISDKAAGVLKRQKKRQVNTFKGTVYFPVPITGSIFVIYKTVDQVVSFTVADTRDPTPRKMVIRKPKKVTYNVEDLKKACGICTLIADALSVQLIVDQSNKFSIKL